MSIALLPAVETLIAPFAGAPDQTMGRAWVFDEYDEEGLRFALLQTSQELRELAALIHEARATTHPVTTAQHIMGQYHIAYRDLRGTLSGVADSDFKREPAPDEWSIRQTLQHMIRTPIFFLTVIRYAIERHRTADRRPIDPPDDVLDPLADALAKQFQIGDHNDDSGTLTEVIGRFDALHHTVVSELGALPDSELDWPSVWWEGNEKSIRFRLLRFEAHMRQHTVQIEKTRQLLGYQPPEAHWLIRQVYNALGEAEGAVLGIKVNGELQQMRSELISKLSDLAAQTAGLLKP